MNYLLKTLVLVTLVAVAFAETLRGKGNEDGFRRELQANLIRKFTMTIDAMEPSNPDQLTTCVTDQMLAVLEEWAQTSVPSGYELLSTNSTISVTTKAGVRDRDLVILAVVPNLKISITLTANNGSCGRCTNKNGAGARNLQVATASVSMVKVLLPQVCPEIKNITTVNMTLTSY